MRDVCVCALSKRARELFIVCDVSPSTSNSG